MKKIILSAGGTGGHIFPMVALYEGLKKENHDIMLITDIRVEKYINDLNIKHFDLYRIKSKDELVNLGLFEEKEDINLIEWPEILLKERFRYNHYFINLELHSENTRLINIKYINKLL